MKALPKPPAAAWAVNQLYWENPKAIDALLSVVERIRKAQTGRVKNVDVRELLGEKRTMTGRLAARAAEILRGANHAASPDAMRRVSATLESLAVLGRTDGAPAAGRLTTDLEAPGFDALAAAMGGAKIDTSKVLMFRPSRVKAAEDPAEARARIREAVQAAEKALRASQRAAAAAEAALKKAEARAAAVETQKLAIEARFAEAKEDVRQASTEAKTAAQRVADAERALSRAKESR